MATQQLHPFLKGTFAWTYLGYFFAEPPPIDLLAPKSLESDNPWLVAAAVLEHAKRGNHRYVPRLRAYFHAGSQMGPERAAIHLTGDAGLESDLPVIQTLLEKGSDEFRAYAAEAAVLAGRLWLAPSMLEAWKMVTSHGHHETIGYSLSSLLEAPGGPIASQAGSFNLPPDAAAALKNPVLRDMAQRQAADKPITEFETVVQNRFDELRGQFGDHAVLWRGQPFSIPILAEQMYALVRDPSKGTIHGLFIPMRHKFESATGINCSDCFRKGVLQPLNAAAVLESFLDSEAIAQYEPGVRYFFGHKIPD
jgi:hypothetical protein